LAARILTKAVCLLYILMLHKFSQAAQTDFEVGIGDELSVTVYNEPDLNVTSLVGPTGKLTIPLLGDMQVAGLTPAQLAKQLEQAYFNGYLVNPNVTVKVINYRPFYIRGAVNNAGAFSYVVNLTVDQAIAVGGGLKERASSRDWIIYREFSSEPIKVSKDTLVAPGDIIEIRESLF